MARKAGSKNKSTLQKESLIRDIVVMQTNYGNARIVDPSAEDITKMSPLEVMLFAMTKAAVAGNWQQAFECAKYAAPYRHAKLSMITTDLMIHADAEAMTDDQLAAIIAQGSANAAETEEGEN